MEANVVPPTTVPLYDDAVQKSINPPEHVGATVCVQPVVMYCVNLLAGPVSSTG
jgi:hypothetical protein